jgi:hypothetical protein
LAANGLPVTLVKSILMRVKQRYGTNRTAFEGQYLMAFDRETAKSQLIKLSADIKVTKTEKHKQRRVVVQQSQKPRI